MWIAAHRYLTKIVFRRVLPCAHSLNYETRVRIFVLKYLEYHRFELDLILCLKIINGYSPIPMILFFEFRLP